MSRNLTIAQTQQAGKVSVSLQWLGLLNLSVVKYYTIINENTALTPFVQTEFPVLDDNDQPISSVSLDSSFLPLGKTCFLKIKAILSDGSSTTSTNTLICNNIDTPQTPLLTSANLREEDRGVSLNLNNLYTLKSLSDGFSPITQVTAYIFKVGGTDANDFIVRQINIDNGYNNWYPIGSFDLENGIKYEIAILATNSAGDSGISTGLINFTPKDTPAQISAPLVRALLTDQRIRGITESDPNGDLVVRWMKPSDYNNLLSVGLPVLKYVIFEQEVDYEVVDGVTTSNLINVGEPVVYDNLTVPSTGKPYFELDTGYTYNSNTYDYEYVIPGNASRLGHKFQYSVYGVNSNGAGPSSVIQLGTANNYIVPFKLADNQVFTVEHVVTVVQGTTPLNLYNGKMSVKVNSLSAINGGGASTINNTTIGYPANNGYDRMMKLRVTRVSDGTTIFNGDIKMIQKINSTTTTIDGNNVTNYTATGVYECLFDNIDTNLLTVGVETLNSILIKGIKYSFGLSRRTVDPAFPAHEFYSISNNIERTKFQSPDAISKVQSYAINDDFSLVRNAYGDAALRMVFNQLKANQMGGMDVFNSSIKYYPYKSSLPVSGLSEIDHDRLLNDSDERQFIIDAPVGQQIPTYVRPRVWNPELSLWIDGNESVPVVIDTAFNHVPAPVSANITKLTSTSVKVSFNKQILTSTGNPTDQVFNRILLFNSDNQNTSPIEWVSPALNNDALNIVEKEFTGLTSGVTYSLFIIPERRYNKITLDNSLVTKRFDNVPIRRNSYTQNFVMNGVPGSPQNIELFPKSSSIDILYDEPSTLEGVLSSTLRVHFFLSAVNESFPFSASPAFEYASVADVAGSASASIDKAFLTKAAATSRDNAVSLTKYTPYYFSARYIGYVGGTTVSLNKTHDLNDGKLNGTSVNTSLNLSALTTVPLEVVKGDYISNVIQTILSDTVPVPTGVNVLPDNGILKFQWTKNSTISDVLIVVNDNDNNPPIAAFDTRNARGTGNYTGLFNLDAAFSNGTLNTAYPAFGTSGFNFIKSDNNTYQMIFSGLTNGQAYNLAIRNVSYNGGDFFSDPVLISRAPEAPPTPILNPSFSVDSGSILATWEKPGNTGGAGIGLNGPLTYRLTVNKVESNGSTSLFGTFNVSGGTLQTISTTITGLTNGAFYTVGIVPYYIKGTDGSTVLGPSTQLNQVTMTVGTVTTGVIKPNAAPVGSTLSVSATNPANSAISSNSIFVNVVTAMATEQTNYPLSKMEVHVRHKATPSLSAKVYEFTTINASGNQTLSTSLINNFSLASAIGTHTGPLNGFEYEVVLKHIPNYTYAQAAADKVLPVTPLGNIEIINTSRTIGGVSTYAPTAVTGSAGKTLRIYVNRNGNSSIQNIVGIAKSSASSSIIVQNLSGASLPTFTNNGTIDVLNGIGANQLTYFDIAFQSLPGVVTDLLTIVSSASTSDALVSPSLGSFFN